MCGCGCGSLFCSPLYCWSREELSTGEDLVGTLSLFPSLLLTLNRLNSKRQMSLEKLFPQLMAARSGATVSII